MTNKKMTKRALVMSVLSLVLCVSMFVGTTFAWFTDEVVSSNNIIKSGSLDVKMLWSEDNNNWKDASTGTTGPLDVETGNYITIATYTYTFGA